MSLYSFCQWCQHTSIGIAIAGSKWQFPIIESVHLLALAWLGGMILAVDLRLAGFGSRRQPLSQFAKDIEPYFIAGLVVMLTTGILLFLSEAMKCYSNPPFWFKMAFLFLAITFTFTVRRRVAMAKTISPLLGKAVAAMSVFLWSGVGFGGRGIGFW
jgi:hypothetical protein